MHKKSKIIVAVTGASGAIYTKQLFDKLVDLKAQINKTAVVFSDNAAEIWKDEIPDHDIRDYPFDYYDKKDFHAPFASGSARYDTMIICPCSMGTLGRITSGTSDDLITRAADVVLKERRKLILIPREAPYSLIHINNMKIVTEAGGIICPASPSFYSKPKNFSELAGTIVDRIIDLAGLENDAYRWGEE